MKSRSGVWSDASKGEKINNHAAVGRLSDTTKRAYIEKKMTCVPQSDVGATSQKGLILKVNNMRATVGRLSDIAERAYIESK